MWKTSSFCRIDSNSENCVETLRHEDGITLRDTSGATVTYLEDEWQAFIKGVKAGEFD